jgi:ribosomal protein S21
MGKKPINVSVKLGGRIRTSEQLIHKFVRMCKDENIIEEYKQKTSYYLTRTQKKRNKKAAGRRRWLRKQKEHQGYKNG